MLAKLLSCFINSAPTVRHKEIELLDINSFKEYKVPTENNKYSIFYNIRTDNQSNFIDFVNTLTSSKLWLCSHIYVFREKEINFLKFANIRTSITEIDSSTRNIDNYFHFPPSIQSDYIIFIDDSFPIPSKHFFNNIDSLMYNIIDQPGIFKIHGPLTSFISKSKESKIQNKYNMIHTKFAIVNYQYMILYNTLIKLMPNQLKEKLGVECADVLLNFFAYKLSKKPLTKIKMEGISQKVLARSLINTTVQNKCIRLIKKYSPRFKWESHSFIEEIPVN